jgi:hypothetical protein
MSPLNPDYRKRDCSLPPGCKDLIDVLHWKSYRKLTYDIAREAGLTYGEAHVVVEEVISHVARVVTRKGANFEREPAKESFKWWMLNITRWCISAKLKSRDKAD